MTTSAKTRHLVLLVIASSLSIIGLTLPWFAARSGSQTVLHTLRSVPVFPWVAVVLIFIIVAGNTMYLVSASQLLRIFVTGSATVLLLVPILSVLAMNLLSMWATPSFMPSTFRRVLIGVTPSTGLWLEITGAILLCVVATGGTDTFLSTGQQLLGRAVRGDRTAIAIGLSAAGAVLYFVSRYQTWVTIVVTYGAHGRQNWTIPGYAMPYIGIISNFEILAILLCAIWQISRPSLGTAAALTSVGFAPLFYGTFAIFLHLIPPEASFNFPPWLANNLQQWSPSVERVSDGTVSLTSLTGPVQGSLQGGIGVIYSMIAGFVVTLAGLVLIYTHKNEVEQS